jgi:hypothetical protein
MDKLHNEELHGLYVLTNIRVTKSRRMKWVRHLVCVKEMRNAYTILVGKPEGKKARGRPSCRWKDDIRMWRAVVKTIVNLRVL